jgi:hypothetical protein
LQVDVAVEGQEFGEERRRVRATFSLNGADYRLAVTDPWIEQRCLRRGLGRFVVRDALVGVSLSEPFHGHAYKLVASIVTRRRADIL